MNAFLFAIVLAVPAQAEPSAEEIVGRATENNIFGFASAQATLTLTLHRPDGSDRVRQLEIRSSKGAQGLRTRVRFLAPAEVAGTGFLVLEHKAAEDEQYLFLPALQKTKRITGRQRDDKFMGTDLSYADIQSKDLRTARLQRRPDATLAGKPVYVVEATPLDPQSSPYTKTLIWVWQDAGMLLKAEFYDRGGQLQKVLAVQRLEKQAGHWVAMQTQVMDVQNKSSTQIRVDQIQFNAPLSDAEFTPAALAGG